jgi:Protein of unknown function (DUF3995)
MPTPQPSQQALGAPETARSGTWPARLAAAWCVLFACAHLFWALGGRAGFVAATGSIALLDQAWFVVIGLWGVALVCLVGAAVCLATVLPFGERVPSWLLRTVLWIGVAVLLLRALPTGVQDLLLVGGVLHPAPGFDWSVVHWRLALWTPWFIVGAVLFVLTTVAHHRRARGMSSARQ